MKNVFDSLGSTNAADPPRIGIFPWLEKGSLREEEVVGRASHCSASSGVLNWMVGPSSQEEN